MLNKLPPGKVFSRTPSLSISFLYLNKPLIDLVLHCILPLSISKKVMIEVLIYTHYVIDEKCMIDTNLSFQSRPSERLKNSSFDGKLHLECSSSYWLYKGMNHHRERKKLKNMLLNMKYHFFKFFKPNLLSLKPSQFTQNRKKILFFSFITINYHLKLFSMTVYRCVSDIMIFYFKSHS